MKTPGSIARTFSTPEPSLPYNAILKKHQIPENACFEESESGTRQEEDLPMKQNSNGTEEETGSGQNPEERIQQQFSAFLHPCKCRNSLTDQKVLFPDVPLLN